MPVYEVVTMVHADTFRILLMRLLPALFWGTVIGYGIYRSKHPVKRSKTEKIALRCILGVFLSIVLLVGVSLAGALYADIASNRVISANRCARNVCNAFQQAVTDLDEAQQLDQRSSEIYTGHLGDEAAEGSLEFYMNRYVNDSCYYAVVTDENWNVRYTLWSRQPITPDKIHIYTRDAQIRFMRSPFKNHSELVGYYENQTSQKVVSSS